MLTFFFFSESLQKIHAQPTCVVLAPAGQEYLFPDEAIAASLLHYKAVSRHAVFKEEQRSWCDARRQVRTRDNFYFLNATCAATLNSRTTEIGPKMQDQPQEVKTIGMQVWNDGLKWLGSSLKMNVAGQRHRGRWKSDCYVIYHYRVELGWRLVCAESDGSSWSHLWQMHVCVCVCVST